MIKALIIVDVQYDFCEGGSLAVEGGLELAHKLTQKVNEGFLNDYDYVVTTQDWHINPGEHFSEKPDFVDNWPKHCVAYTHGAEIIKELSTRLKGNVDIAVHKGQYEAAYSGFDGVVTKNNNSLLEELKKLRVTDVDVCGIATDYCVKETAFDASKNGFRTTVLKDFSVGISSENVKKLMENEFSKEGVMVK